MLPRDYVLPLTRQHVKFHPRHRLKANGTVRRMRSVAPPAKGTPPLPPAPPALDMSQGRKIQYPIDGNDEYGDCYYAAACHQVQSWTAQYGPPASFDEQAIIDAYLALAGGDNGLSDDEIFGEWAKGLVGGEHQAIDHMVVPDAATMRVAMYLFGGGLMTLAIPDAWLKLAKPGAVWTAGRGVSPDQNNGHAVHWSGYSGTGFSIETWAMDPPITITDAGLAVCDPEMIVAFSLDNFDASGVANNGHTYDELAAWWVSLGGDPLPPWTGPVTPPTPPPPPVTSGFSGTLTFAGGILTSAVPSAAHQGAPDWQAIIEAILALLAALGYSVTRSQVIDTLYRRLQHPSSS